tara:strand:+ start:77018 stop:78859 length:1842 start_codon:yes stop_codon:yes gene_type:complete
MKQLHGHFALRTSARLLLSSIAALSFSTSIYADDTLDSITVTANRIASENVLVPTTVITRSDIERLQINDLATLLSRQTGIDMTNSGGLGKPSSISIRGTGSDHVLVLVDGVKWFSATAGGASFQNFPVEQIERIEIVRGSRSGLYGSEAVGGVIQIFTREGKQGVTPYAKLGYGTHNSKQVAAGVGGGDENTRFSVNVNHESTDGINAKINVNPDKDGYRNNSFSAKLNHQINEKIDIGVNFLRAEGHNQSDPFSSKTETNNNDSVQQILGVNSNIILTDLWTLSFELSESRDQLESFKNSAVLSKINTRHRAATVTNTFILTPEQTLNIGLDYDIDDIDSSENYLLTSRDNKAAFVSWQGEINKHGWLISGRHDDNEAFGHQNTGNAEYGYWLLDDLRVSVNAATAFKSPTFNDLYWPSSAYSAGNPDLLPEKSKSFGAGINGRPQWGTWSVNVYQNEIKNLISWQQVTPGFYTPSNVAKVQIRGIEFDVATVLAGWDVALNASFLKPEDEETDNILARRAQRLANVNIDRQWGAWSTGASWKLRGHSFDNASNTTRLGGFGLLDMHIAYDLSQDWSVKANLSNAFNKEYETVNNYNSLDRTVMFTLLYQP